MMPELPSLKRLREQALMTQLDLATKAGLSAVTVARAEARHPMRFSTIHKLAKALGVEASVLVEKRS